MSVGDVELLQKGPIGAVLEGGLKRDARKKRGVRKRERDVEKALLKVAGPGGAFGGFWRLRWRAVPEL